MDEKRLPTQTGAQETGLRYCEHSGLGIRWRAVERVDGQPRLPEDVYWQYWQWTSGSSITFAARSRTRIAFWPYQGLRLSKDSYLKTYQPLTIRA